MNLFYKYMKFLMLLVPIAVVMAVITMFGVNTLFYDDFITAKEYLNILNTGSVNWHQLCALNNEHRMFFPKILIYIIAAFTHYNTKAMMFFSGLLMGASYLLIAREMTGKNLMRLNFYEVCCVVMVGICFANVLQYDNWLWGFQIAWILIDFCLVGGLIALGAYLKTQKRKYIITANICAFVASFSSLHGLNVWLCFVVIMAMYQLRELKFDKKIWLNVLPMMALSFGLYFYGYHGNAMGNLSKTSSSKEAACFVLDFFGGIFTGNQANEYSAWLGIGVIALSLLLILKVFIQNKIKENVLAIGMILFGLGFAVMLGVGRSRMFSLTSRYVTFSLVVLAGDMMILLKNNLWKTKTGKISAVLFTVLMFGGLLWSDYKNYPFMKGFYGYRLDMKKIILAYKTGGARSIMPMYSAFWDMSHVMEDLEAFEKARLSAFYE